ncbi:His/Gly/Thr/Pro-type tRNA ligase C-terminal domain-containing protein, partial [Corynebacterium belfantii]
AAKREMVRIIDALRSAGISADMSYGDRGLKGAMKGADRAGARFALVLGDRELENNCVAVKDLAQQGQRDVALDSLIVEIQSAL